MANTFKTPPYPSAPPAPVKPISERDFFDLTDEMPPANQPAFGAKEDGNSSNIVNNSNTKNTSNKVKAGTSSNIGKFNNTDDIENIQLINQSGNKGSVGITSVTNNTGNTNMDAPSVPGSKTDLAGGVRQTFVFSRGYLEQLRDYVHARRTQGDYYYSQKQALQEALNLLFAQAEPAPPRPAQAREREQQHRERIQQGRRPTNG